MHRQRVLHRDIKPENILLDGEGYIKVTDLGISVEMDKLRGPGERMHSFQLLARARNALAAVDLLFARELDERPNSKGTQAFDTRHTAFASSKPPLPSEQRYETQHAIQKYVLMQSATR